ncbi:MAG: glycosyltransferase [Phocaeicola sp.]
MNDFDISIALSIVSRDTSKIDALKELWPNVTFYIHFRDKKRGIDPTKSGKQIFLEWINASCKRITKKKNFQEESSTLYSSLYSSFSTDFCDFIYELTRKGFDMIQTEFYDYLPLIYLFPANTKSIFIHHELRYVRNQNEYDLFKERKHSDSLLLNVAKTYEIATLSQYDYIFTLSNIDALHLKELIHSDSQIKVSPAALVKNVKESSMKFAPNRNNRLVFLGSESHYPNFDAVIWFCNEIAPLLRMKNFNFTLEIIGDWKARHLMRHIHKTPELRFLGYVEELEKCMEGSIMIVPIRIGSGIRIKILEAINSYIPFVTTTKGTEGIDMRQGQECLIADSPEKYAESIIELCGNCSLQETLALNAFERLQYIYIPSEMIEIRKKLYHEIVATAKK